ncbi:MAG TPA: cytochrome P450 [Trebonia sp.]|jgi:cytochrome P450|nr:cytochrome P450 [Trebonia sp.]
MPQELADLPALELSEANFIQDPYSLYARLRETQPACRVLTPNKIAVWLVTRYDDVRELLANPSLHKDMRVTGPLFERHTAGGIRRQDFGGELVTHMLNSDPPDHARLRRLVGKAFTARRIALMRPRIEAIADGLLESRRSGERVDLIESFAYPMAITVICELLGVPAEDRAEFRQWSGTLVSSVKPELAKAASGAMAEYLTRLLAAKRDDPHDDLLTALIQASDDEDKLSESELISMAYLLLVAGHETTVNLIANGTLALISQPDQLSALVADPGLLPGAIEEFLRYEGSLNLATFRYTTEPVRVGEITIPADEFVLLALASANHDPRRFPDGDRLEITRNAAGHVAFGHGIHHCLGAPLARLEGEIAFTGLLRRFPSPRLAEDWVPRWRASLFMRSLTELPVVL